jgi:dTDP-4-dehydrorhamnose reductase
MRALVLGHSGQVAQSLMACAGDIDAHAFGRPTMDLTVPDQVEAIVRRVAPEIVINAAAYTTVDRAETDAANAFALNAEGAATAARAARVVGAQFLHLSTDFVFDGAKQGPYLEDDPANPPGVYGQSKYEGELAVRAAHADAVIVRLSWVYSAVGTNFAKTMLRLAAARDEIGVVDDQQGRPTAAEDIAPALWTLARGMTARSSPQGLYHLAASGRGSWADFAEQIMAASQAVGGPTARIKRITTSDYPTPARRPANSVLDCQRIATDWGIRLPDWRESCDRVVRQIVRAGVPASA